MINFEESIPFLVAQLKQLVEIETPSHDKSALDRMGDFIASESRRLGAQVIIHPQKEIGNLIEAQFASSTNMKSSRAESADDKEGENKSILLLAHMDTVFPMGILGKMPFHDKDGKVFGPGVADMKGGIVVALGALKAAIKSGSLAHPVTVLFTSDEEIGSIGSRSLVEKLATESGLVLVLEPGMPDGAVKTWRKGVGEFTVCAHGRAAHAGGDHEKGRNAIEEIAHQVIAIQKMTDYSKGTTLNVGTIHGGIASNVVPDEASIEVDLRVMMPGEADRIGLAMQALKPAAAGTSLEIRGGLNRPPMPFTTIIKSTFEKIKDIAAWENINLAASGTGGASDANFVAALGIPVLDGLGPAGGDYHSEREYIIKDSLAERTKLLCAIFRDW